MAAVFFSIKALINQTERYLPKSKRQTDNVNEHSERLAAEQPDTFSNEVLKSKPELEGKQTLNIC